MAFQEEVVLTIYVVLDAKMGTVRTRSVSTFIPPQKPQIVFNSESGLVNEPANLKRTRALFSRHGARSAKGGRESVGLSAGRRRLGQH
jgi:hypothetical protein